MKLIVQIPCLDEAVTLPATIADIPRQIDGIDEVEILVIDDGSTDGTSRVAREHGADHVVRFPRNRGLGHAFKAGFDTCLRLGADIIVNTDGDNQYFGGDVATLVRPILDGEAHIVIGDRLTGGISHFSFAKRFLQRFGSSVVGRLASIRVNPKARESRLFSNVGEFVLKSGTISLRTYARYKALKLFAACGAIAFFVGFAIGLRFLYFFFGVGEADRYVQSLILASVLLMAGFQMFLTGIVADLIATNRTMLEDALSRVKKLELPRHQVTDADGGADTPGN